MFSTTRLRAALPVVDSLTLSLLRRRSAGSVRRVCSSLEAAQQQLPQIATAQQHFGGATCSVRFSSTTVPSAQAAVLQNITLPLSRNDLRQHTTAFFAVGWSLADASEDRVAPSVDLFDPATDEHLSFSPTADGARLARVWLSKRAVGRTVALLPFQEDATLEALRKALPEFRMSNDAWTVVFGTFTTRQRRCPGSVSARSVEHAVQILAPSAPPVPTVVATAGWGAVVWIALSLCCAELPSGDLPIVRLTQLCGMQLARVVMIRVTRPPRTLKDPTRFAVEIFDADRTVSKTFRLLGLPGDKNQVAFVKEVLTPERTTIFIPCGSVPPDGMSNDIHAVLRGAPKMSRVVICDLNALREFCASRTGNDQRPSVPSVLPALLPMAWSTLKESLHASQAVAVDVLSLFADSTRPRRAVVATPQTSAPVVSTPPPRVEAATAAPPPASSAPAATPQSAAIESTSTGASTVAYIAGKFDSSPQIASALKEWVSTIYDSDARDQREQKCLSKFQRFCVLDLETTTKRAYKRVANPFIPENRVVLPGYLDYKGALTIPNQYLTTRDAMRLPPLDDYDVLVGHNIKFDLLYLWRDPELLRFLRRGGAVWDTMYAEYLLTGQMVKLGRNAALDEVARSYGGEITKLDEVKEAWAAGKDTTDIPHATLAKYLQGDLLNTRLIFLAQRERALKQRQVVIIDARMDSLLCTTEMEFNGLKIDVPTALEQGAALVQKAALLKQSLTRSVPPELGPLKKYFNWASTMHMAAYLFGGELSFDTGSYSLKAEAAKRRAAASSEAAKETDTADVLTAPLGGEGYMAPPDDITAPAHCAFLAGFRHVAPTSKFFSSYIAPFLTGRGLRRSDPMIRAFETTEEIVANYTVLLFGAPGVTLGGASSSNEGSVPSCEAEVNALADSLPTACLWNPVTGEKVTWKPQCATSSSAVANESRTTLATFIAAQMRKPAKLPNAQTTLQAQMQDPLRKRLIIVAEGIQQRYTGHLVRHLLRAALSSSSSESQSQLQPCDDVLSLVSFADAGELRRFVEDLNVTSSASSATTTPNADTEASCQQFATYLRDVVPEALKTRLKEEIAKLDKIAAKPTKVLKHDSEVAKLRVAARATFVENSAALQGPFGLATLLQLIGCTVGSPFDCFVSKSHLLPKVTITLPGRLSQMYPNSGATARENRQRRRDVLLKFRSETGRMQAGVEALRFFADLGDSVAKDMSELRSMEKLIGTYYEAEGTGMVSLVNEHDSCIHHELKHNNTQTGRLASANPNCQNIPKEGKSTLREMFVSRFADGVCVEADYSQLEVITLAALSRDVQMTADIKNEVDFHCKRVTMMLPQYTYDEVVQKAKKLKIPEFVALRQAAKVFSFQRQYGAGIRTLAESTKMSPEAVKKLIDAEQRVYHGCELFTKMVTLSVHKYDPTLQDGSRNSKGDILHKGSFPVITGSIYCFSENDVPDFVLDAMRENGGMAGKTTAFSPTFVKNYPVQGFAGEIVQIMIGRLYRHFVANNNYGGKALLTNTVHDCVWVDCTKDVVAVVAADVRRILSNARAVLNELWPEFQCEVDFPVDVVAGPNMGHVAPVKG